MAVGVTHASPPRHVQAKRRHKSGLPTVDRRHGKPSHHTHTQVTARPPFKGLQAPAVGARAMRPCLSEASMHACEHSWRILPALGRVAFVQCTYVRIRAPRSMETREGRARQILPGRRRLLGSGGRPLRVDPSAAAAASPLNFVVSFCSCTCFKLPRTEWTGSRCIGQGSLVRRRFRKRNPTNCPAGAEPMDDGPVAIGAGLLLRQR